MSVSQWPILVLWVDVWCSNVTNPKCLQDSRAWQEEHVLRDEEERARQEETVGHSAEAAETVGYNSSAAVRL